MMVPPLDLDAVQAFVRIVELGSFTRAAEAMGTTQAAVSLRLKRLEERLGCRLVERTPRYLQLSARGAAFLERARELLAAHDHALAFSAGTRQRLTVGISDHVAGPELPALIARMNAQDPQLLIEIRIASSGDLLQSFDRRELDTVIVRLHAGRSGGGNIIPKKKRWCSAAGGGGGGGKIQTKKNLGVVGGGGGPARGGGPPADCHDGRALRRAGDCRATSRRGRRVMDRSFRGRRRSGRRCRRDGRARRCRI